MLRVGELYILSPKRNVWDEHAPDFWPTPFTPGPGRKLPTPTQAIVTSNPLVVPTANVVPLPQVEPTAQATVGGTTALRAKATAFVPVRALETTTQNAEGRLNVTASWKQDKFTTAMPPQQPSAAVSKATSSGDEATPAGPMAGPDASPADNVTALVSEAPEVVGGLVEEELSSGDEDTVAPGNRPRRRKRRGNNHHRRTTRKRAAEIRE